MTPPPWVIWIDLASTVILALSFAALVWYAWETRQLRFATEAQTRHALMPVMEVWFRDPAVVVGNSGIGTAAKIVLQGIRYFEPNGGLIECTFDPVYMLSPNREFVFKARIRRKEPRDTAFQEVSPGRLHDLIVAMGFQSDGFTHDLYYTDTVGTAFQVPVVWEWPDPARHAVGLGIMQLRTLEPVRLASLPASIELVEVKGKSLVP